MALTEQRTWHAGGVTIRLAQPADLPAALEVWRAAQAARGLRPNAARIARVEEKLATELVVLGVDALVVALAVGEPHRDDPERVHLSMLFVHPSRQREGIGTDVLEGFADEAWSRGFRTLSVWTRTPEFYEACGLERTGAVDGEAVELLAELEAPLRDLLVRSDGIRLGQLLKLAEMVDTGSEGKELLAEGGVEVNGEVELRRGRQMVSGDVVSARDQSVRVVIGPA